MQWSSSIEVLQKPYGMEPGEEVSATVFVLAFDEQRPKFENWQLGYRCAAVSGSAPSQAAAAATTASAC